MNNFIYNRLDSRQERLLVQQRIRRVQEEILAAPDCHPAYRNYAAEEIGYWWPIASQLFRKVEDSAQPGSFLDIGAAYGALTVYLARKGWEPHVVDQYDTYLAPSIKKKYAIDFHVQNVETAALPFPDESFDIVLFTEVLEHLNYNPLTVLGEIYRVLKPGGMLFLSTPDKDSWGESEIRVPFEEIPRYFPDAPIKDDHMKIYDEAELTRLLESCHFQINLMRRHTARRVGLRFKSSRHLDAIAVK